MNRLSVHSLSILFCLLGCGLSEPTGELRTSEVPRADGSQITYHLMHRSASPQRGIVALMQGSGCGYAARNERLRDLAGFAPEHSILLVEKIGVDPTNQVRDGVSNGCSEAFLKQNSIDRRVDDVARVLDHLAIDARWWNGDLILAGVSTGVLVASLVAERIREVDEVILVSGTPTDFRETVLFGIRNSMRERGARESAIEQFIADTNAAFDSILAAPDATPSAILGGQTHRFWASALAKDYLGALARTDVPILLVQASEDARSDVSVARNVQRKYREMTGRCNFHYLEIDDLGHSLEDGDGISRISEVSEEIEVWLKTVSSDSSCETNRRV